MPRCRESDEHKYKRQFGVGQPRIAEIMSFNTKYFSVDLLLKYLARLGTKVSFQFKKSKAA